jgi:hypothetical protein
MCLVVVSFGLAADERPADAERIQQLIGQLAADDFPTRQRADQELEKLGLAALPALREALARNQGLEMKQRVERLLNRIEVKSWRSPDGYVVKKRLERVLELDPKLDDEQRINAVYLLTHARSASEREKVGALEQLKQAKDQNFAVLDLARALVNGRDFDENVAAANVKLFDLQARLQAGPEPLMQLLVQGTAVNELARELSAKLAKVTGPLTQRQITDLLFLLTLSRFPTEKENATLEKRLRLDKDRGQMADLLWALLNCNEFLIRGK